MDTTANSLVTALIDVGNIDTVYRDVYQDRARTLFSPVLPLDSFRRLEQERATAEELPRTIARAVETANWPVVKQLSQRAQELKRAIDDKGPLLEIARSVYDVRDVRLDPFSPGLQPFTRMPIRDLPTLAMRALDLLATLERADAAWSDFYVARSRALQTRRQTPSDMLDPAAATASAPQAEEAARQALAAGDMSRLAALADVLIAAGRPSGSAGAVPANLPAMQAETEPGPGLQAAAYPGDALNRARRLGLALRHLEPRVELASLRRYAWTPSSDERGNSAAARVPLPPGAPEALQDGLAVFMIHPLVNSGGARYLPSLVAEDVLVEDFPDPAEGGEPPPSELVQSLRLPSRRALPRIAIEEALFMHGARILRDELGLDSRVFRLVCIPSDVYVRVGEAEGWGRQPFWTHFDGYLVMPDGRLRALAGGDARFGGLYELLAVGRQYDSDRLLARFAVVQRARMTAW